MDLIGPRKAVAILLFALLTAINLPACSPAPETSLPTATQPAEAPADEATPPPTNTLAPTRPPTATDLPPATATALPTPEPGTRVEETLLYTIDDPVFPWNLRVSPDMTRLGYLSFDDQHEFAVIDGTPDPAYDEVINLQFSPDSQRVLYSATRGDQEMVVVDGVAGEKHPAESIIGLGARFSPDSQRVLYTVTQGNQEMLVVDGTASNLYDEVHRGKYQFSPDSQRVGFSATIGEQELVVVDGVESDLYDEADFKGFSPDGQRYAYSAMLDGQAYIILKGEDLEPYPFDSIRKAHFSPDSTRFAFIGKRGEEVALVVDNQIGPLYGTIYNIEFSPDSERLAYIVRLAPFPQPSDEFMLVDGEPGEPFSYIGPNLVFSPDSQHVAHSVITFSGGEPSVFVVVDGVAMPPYPYDSALNNQSISPIHIQYTPDSQRLAYVVPTAGQWQVVVDGEAGPAFQQIGNGWDDYGLVFSPDSQHLVYQGFENNQFQIIVDQKEVAAYDWAFGSVVFSGPDQFHCLALKSHSDTEIGVYLVEAEIR